MAAAQGNTRDGLGSRVTEDVEIQIDQEDLKGCERNLDVT